MTAAPRRATSPSTTAIPRSRSASAAATSAASKRSGVFCGQLASHADLEQDRPLRARQGGQGAPGTWISIFVDDVDALHADYRRTGAIIRQPPTDYPWGLREMNVEDLDGHRLRSSEPPTADA